MHLFSLIITVTKISKSLKIAFSYFPFSFFFYFVKSRQLIRKLLLNYEWIKLYRKIMFSCNMNRHVRLFVIIM